MFSLILDFRLNLLNLYFKIYFFILNFKKFKVFIISILIKYVLIK